VDNGRERRKVSDYLSKDSEAADGRSRRTLYLQLASAAKASKHSTAVAEKISGKCSTSMKAPFQVILLKAILHSSKKLDVTAVTLFFWRLSVSGPACICDGAYDRAPADAVNSQSRFSCSSRS
jgi:hypothetical protein